MMEEDRREITVKFNPYAVIFFEYIVLITQAKVERQIVDEEKGYIWIIAVADAKRYSLLMDYLYMINSEFYEIVMSVEELIKLVTKPIQFKQIESKCRSLFKTSTVANRLAQLLGEELSPNVITIILRAKTKDECFNNLQQYFKEGEEQQGGQVAFESLSGFNDNSLKNAQLILKNIILFNYN